MDINAALREHGLPDTPGAVVVRYSFIAYGAVSAVVTSADESHWLYLNSVAQSREEFWYGTSLDAVIWSPEDQYVNLKGPLSIVRSISQNPDKSWKFTVTKSACTATINPI